MDEGVVFWWRWLVAVTLGVAVFGVSTVRVQPVAPPRAGVLVTTSGRSVLAMAGPALASGAVVTLVTIDEPQRSQRATVTGSLAASEAMAGHDVPGPYYEVAPPAGSDRLPEVAVAVLGRATLQRVGTSVSLRLEDPSATVRVRSCASSEGLHLTLWDGEPLKSTRLWHAYYYLGYDVEPTCEPGDYRDEVGPR